MIIRNHTIDPDEDVYIVAEVGISHMGDYGAAKRGVEWAASAGANAVKFQHHIAAEEMARSHPWYRTIQLCELTLAQQEQLRDYAHEKGLAYICTPFCTRAAEELISIEPDAIKVGSGEVSHLEMLETIRDGWSGPVILSGGMHRFTESDSALRLLGEPERLAWLYCRSKYPTAPEETGLSLGADCGDAFVEAGLCAGWGVSLHSKSGYAGSHSEAVAIAVSAASLGAQVIECHLSPFDHWDRNRREHILGIDEPDGSVALGRGELAGLVSEARVARRAIQPCERHDEEGIKALATHRAYALCDIREGEPFAGKVGYRRQQHGWPASLHRTLAKLSATSEHKRGDAIPGGFSDE